MPRFIPSTIILFGAGLSLLTSLGQLTLRERRTENYNLSLLFLVMGLCLVQIYFIGSGLYLENPDLMFLFMTFAYLLGPVLFSAYYYVIFPVKNFPIKKLLLFMPSMMVLLADVYYLLLPKDSQLEILNGLLSGNAGVKITAIKCLIGGASVQMIGYLSFLLYLLCREKKKRYHGAIMNVDIAYTFLSMLTHTVLVSGAIFSSKILISLGGIMSSILLICAYVVGFRFPEFLQLLLMKAVKKTGKPPIPEHETTPAKEQLMKLMLEEKIYTEEDITLQDLADELSLTIHQTSHLINEHFDMNFNNFINRFRVDEARKILVEDPSRSIISIAHEVGFSSKSAFYSAFSRFTGMTPTTFRIKNSEKNI